MATATRRRGGTTATKTTAKKAKPAPEPEVDELEDLEPEDVEDEDDADTPDDEVEEEDADPKAKKKAAAKKAGGAQPTNGTQWLAKHVNEVLGTDYKPYDLRVILRRLAKKGKLQREVGADRSRYDFDGPKDPVVLALIKMLKAGELEKDRKEKLDALKEKGAAKKKPKKAAKDEDEEVGDDLDEEEAEELDDDE